MHARCNTLSWKSPLKREFHAKVTRSVGSFDTRISSRLLCVYRTTKPEFTMTAICSVSSQAFTTPWTQMCTPRYHLLRHVGLQWVPTCLTLTFAEHLVLHPLRSPSNIFHHLSFHLRWAFIWDFMVVGKCLFEALILWKLWYLPSPFRRKMLKRYHQVCANSVVEHPPLELRFQWFLFCSTPVSVKA